MKLVTLGAAIALIWANTAGDSYFRFAHALAFPVNEIGMALFVALVAQETYEAAMPGGALHTWRHWTMPIAAATGGVLFSALTYFLYVSAREEQLLSQAWPIACAIDVVAGYYLLKTIDRRGAMLPFFLLLAIATNAFGLVVMAAWPGFRAGQAWGTALVVAAVALAAVLRGRGVSVFWPYFAGPGALSWFGCYLVGAHPALALVPIVPFMPHEPRGIDLFADPPDDDEVHRAEHAWNGAAQVVVFLFALVNAGVVLRGYDTGTWALLIAALAGRPIGILAAAAIAVAAGLRLPRGTSWRHLLVIALAASSGFTFALFFAAGLLPIGAVLQQIKIGALLTAAGAPITLAAAWRLRVGRYSRRH